MRVPSVLFALSTVIATYYPGCGAELVRPTFPPHGMNLQELWEPPGEPGSRDLFNGPWGAALAPDPDGVYTFVKPKTGGMNPGMTVRDAEGRQWSVKQASYDGLPSEGPIEVVVSRLLSAVGYHQPPVYFLRAFTLRDSYGTRREPGGRFRVTPRNLKDTGVWSWQSNDFVGTRPYQGLLVILLMLNSSDLKNENNTVYSVTGAGAVKRWFVVRDLGIALGRTGRVSPARGNAKAFAEAGFITGIRNGYVEFDYRGFHKELVDQRITPEEVRWASALLDRLTEGQWYDAFRAGGYTTDEAEPFIRRVMEKIAQGKTIGLTGPEPER
jgi:hypothetical protein